MHHSTSLFAAAAIAFSVAPFALAQEPAAVTTPAMPLQGPAPAAPAKQQPVFDEAADARAAVKLAVRAAARENRRVLIEWGANWCGWCNLLAARFKSETELQKKLLYEYDVVKVDVGHFDKNLDLAKELGAEFKAIPYLTILDADGKAIVQQNTEPFEIEGERPGHDPKKLLAFLTEHQAAPLDAAAVRDAAFAMAKKTNKRVFLHFGAPWCGWCHELENWMRESAPAALLAKDFIDLKIDTDRMTGGQSMLADLRLHVGAKGDGIPWIVFLDADGKVLATSDAPKGNTGFPSKDHEIAWFGEMLGKARVNLTEGDIATLQQLLVTWREASKQRQGH